MKLQHYRAPLLFSLALLLNNRELGLIFNTGVIITTLQQNFQQDWSVSQSV